MHAATGLGSRLSLSGGPWTGLVTEVAVVGNGKLAVSVGCCTDRSLQTSSAKTADGSIPFSIFKNSGRSALGSCCFASLNVIVSFGPLPKVRITKRFFRSSVVFF